MRTWHTDSHETDATYEADMLNCVQDLVCLQSIRIAFDYYVS
ncbi:hypothetical protein BO443_210094 [Burkholderia orbicola]